MTKTEQDEIALSEAQQQHLAPLIANLNIAAANLNAAKTIQQAGEQQVERRQREFDAAEDTANGFLRYCGREHGIPLDTGQWDFDTKRGVFFRIAPQPGTPLGTQLQERPLQEGPQEQPKNGVVENATNLT